MAESTPVASPAATPLAAPITIVGEGTVRDNYAETPFVIDVHSDGSNITGEFSMEFHMGEDTVWPIHSDEFVSLAPLSEMSPYIKRLVGYAIVGEGEDQPYILEVRDGRTDDKADAINLVIGLDALPFLGEQVKPGCNCGISISLRSDVVEGEITITG